MPVLLNEVEKNVAIAAAIERGITSQSELLISLSLAIIGGLLALRFQLLLHNASQPKRPLRILRARWYVAVLILAALTILLGFSISGKLLTISPMLYSMDFGKSPEFLGESIEGGTRPTLLQLARAQVVTFIASAALGATVLLSSVIGKSVSELDQAATDLPDGESVPGSELDQAATDLPDGESAPVAESGERRTLAENAD